jgi:hypothetical protein
MSRPPLDLCTRNELCLRLIDRLHQRAYCGHISWEDCAFACAVISTGQRLR